VETPEAQTCYTVEGRIVFVVEGVDEADDHNILSKAYTTVQLAFLALPLDEHGRVSYIGNDPFSLTSDKLSKMQDMSTSDNDVSIFAIIFFVITICEIEDPRCKRKERRRCSSRQRRRGKIDWCARCNLHHAILQLRWDG